MFDLLVPSRESMILLRNASIPNIQEKPYGFKQNANKDIDREIVLGDGSHLGGKVAEELMNAGVNLTNLSGGTLRSLPSWSQLIEAFGTEIPHIIGLETCDTFQDKVEGKERYVGVSGLFNSGTNVLAYLLDENCSFDKGDALWQVPWGKHSRAARRDVQTVKGYEKYNKNNVLPAVVIRNPFDVMESLCRNSYTVSYPEHANSSCPYMVDHGTGELLRVEVGRHPPKRVYSSVADFWNAWNQEYVDFPYPRLILRLEDLTMRPQETIKTVCECAGGRIAENFTYAIASAKEGMGHGRASEKNGLVEAWTRLGKAVSFPAMDYQAAKSQLDEHLMADFNYQYPNNTVNT